MLMASLICAMAFAEPPKPIDPAAFDRMVMDSLRDIHNRGASLYNDGKDYAGCLRLYEGSLRTVRPLLAHRPAVQKLIDDNLVKLNDEDPVRSKAFRLHELIEMVRGELRDGAAKPVEPKPVNPMPTAKSPVNAPAPVPLANVPTTPTPAAVAVWLGAVSLAGKSMNGVEVTFVSLDLPEPKIVSAISDANGRFRAVLPAFGRYAMMVTGTGVPERYHTTTASGLRANFQSGTAGGDLNLNEK